jgi:hypothetical protein
VLSRSELKSFQAHRDYPSVSILAPTHRTAPSNKQDPITLTWGCSVRVADLVAMSWRSAWPSLPRNPSPTHMSTPVARRFAVRASGLPRRCKVRGLGPKRRGQMPGNAGGTGTSRIAFSASRAGIAGTSIRWRCGAAYRPPSCAAQPARRPDPTRPLLQPRCPPRYGLVGDGAVGHLYRWMPSAATATRSAVR